MEISQPTIGIFYVSKILALAPYSAKRNTKGHLQISRSWIFTIYSVCLCVIMVFLTYRGLLFDANSKIPVRSHKFKFGIFIFTSCWQYRLQEPVGEPDHQSRQIEGLGVPGNASGTI